MSQRDRYWIRRALVLARQGLGQTQPNPLVGAIVLSAGGEPIGTGYHERTGQPHAEAIAIKHAGEGAKGGTLYVTLEPCNHQGRTPPCTETIIQSGVRRVVIATHDPNPNVQGKGIERLRDAKIEIDVGCEETSAKTLNAPFFLSVRESRPLVTAKLALSADGKMGYRDKRVILTGPVAEKTTMRLRAEAGAILVGVNTIVTDNPRLTVRGRYRSRKPIRAILDPTLRTPADARLFKEDGGPIWIFCAEGALRRRSTLKDAGATIVGLSTDNHGQIPPRTLLEALHKQGVTSLLIEGGARTLANFAAAHLIDRWVLLTSNRPLGMTIGGSPAIGVEEIAPFPLRFHSVIRRGPDWEMWAETHRT